MLPLAFVLGIGLPPQGTPAPPARIEGTVVDTLCAVVADAEVVALVQGREVARGRSDGNGAFVLADVPHEIVIVRARGKGLAWAVARVDLTGDDVVAPRLQCFAGRTLTGHVSSGGKPVAGAQVIAEPEDLPEFADAPPCAVTGADGSYRLEGVVIGPAVLRVWAPGCALAEQASTGPGDAVVDFAMSSEDVSELVVRVRNASPAQLASAQLELSARRRRARILLPPALTRAKVDADGLAHLPGWPSELEPATVVLRIPGATTLPWRQELVARDFYVLSPADSTLRGVVRGPDGPLAHRRLLVQPYDDAEWSFAVVRGETGADGSFALRCPVDKGEKFALRLVDDEWVADQLREEEPAGRAWYVGAFNPAARLQVVAVRAFDLRPRLRAPDGSPVGGALVSVTANDFVLGSGQSCSDGTAELVGLNVSSFRVQHLSVQSPKWVVPHLRITGAADFDAAITGAMVPAGVVTGRVLVGKEGLAGCRVRLTTGSETSRQHLPPRIAVTDAEGRFRFDGLRAGRADLVAWGRRAKCEVRAGEETTVSLQ